MSCSVSAEDTQKNAPQSEFKTLCTGNESALFSCDINSKTVSLCASLNKESKYVERLNYRFGDYGKPPELDYSNRDKPISEAFSFSSVNRGFLLQTIGFSRGNVSYDVLTPDSKDYVRWVDFTGVGVTIGHKPTKLLKCDQGSIFVNLLPLKETLGVTPEGGLSDASPKVNVQDSPYPIVKKDIPHGKKWISKLVYPTINDAAISTEISKFAKECDDPEDEESNEGECLREVSAKIINNKLLTLNFVEYEYHTGTPHGYGNSHTLLYKKSSHGWHLIKSDDLFDSSDQCQALIGSLIYRRLKPLMLSKLEDGTVGPDDILDEADVSVDAQGVEFTFQQYQLGAYAEGPGSITVPYKSLGKCFRW